MRIIIQIGAESTPHNVIDGARAEDLVADPTIQNIFGFGANVDPVINGHRGPGTLKEGDVLSIAQKASSKGA